MLLRRRLEFPELFELLNDALHDLAAFFDVRIFTTAEHDGNLNLVLMFQEANRLLHLELDVVFTRLGSQPNLFGLGAVTVLILFLFLVVFVLAEVHDTTNGRTLIGSYLNQIKACFSSLGKCVVSFNNS